MFNNSYVQSSTSLALRGPKKKKGAVAAAAPESSDIVNIWKDRQDVTIYSSDRYPPWLMKMLDEQYTPDDVMFQILRGERLPTASEQWTLARSVRRTMVADQNRMYKMEWEYESEDDVGEDIGKFEEEEAELTIEGTTGTAEGAAKEGGAGGEGAKKEGGDDKQGGDKK